MVKSFAELDRITTGLVGIFISPLAAAVLTGLIGQISGQGEFRIFHIADWLLLFYVGVITQVIFIVVPIFLIATYFHVVNLFTSLTVGIAMGAYMSFFTLHGDVPWEVALSRFYANGPIGAASAFVFWLVWRKGEEL